MVYRHFFHSFKFVSINVWFLHSVELILKNSKKEHLLHFQNSQEVIPRTIFIWFKSYKKFRAHVSWHQKNDENYEKCIEFQKNTWNDAKLSMTRQNWLSQVIRHENTFQYRCSDKVNLKLKKRIPQTKFLITEKKKT